MSAPGFFIVRKYILYYNYLCIQKKLITIIDLAVERQRNKMEKPDFNVAEEYDRRYEEINNVDCDEAEKAVLRNRLQVWAARYGFMTEVYPQK